MLLAICVCVIASFTATNNPATATAADNIAKPLTRRIAVGKLFGIAVDENGVVHSWGLNNHGQLGDGTTATDSLGGLPAGSPLVDYPTATVKLPSGIKATSVSAGLYNGFAWDQNGDMWCWGLCGTDDKEQPTPQRFNPTGVHFVDVYVDSDMSDGYYALIKAIDNNGGIWAWRTNSEYTKPKKIMTLTGKQFVQIAGNNLLTSDGEVYSISFPTGVLIEPQLNKTDTGVKKISLATGLAADGTLRNYGVRLSGSYTSINAKWSSPAGVKFDDVASNGRTIIATSSDGLRYEWGDCASMDYGDLYGAYEQTSPCPNYMNSNFIVNPMIIRTGVYNEIAFATGVNTQYYTAAADERGYIWAWGISEAQKNNNGDIFEVTDNLGNNTPIRIGIKTRPTVSSNPTVVQMPTTGAPEGLHTVGALAIGVGLAGVSLMLSRRRD